MNIILYLLLGLWLAGWLVRLCAVAASVSFGTSLLVSSAVSSVAG